MKAILIVDDQVDLVELLKRVLIENGFDVLSAYDGKEALEQYQKRKPDLILLDLTLPKMTGDGVCRAIRKDHDDWTTKIIMLTARDEEADQIVGKVLGADKYITKPFDSKQLIQEINALLNPAS